MRTISLSYAFAFCILARSRRSVATNFLSACSRLSGSALGSFIHGYGISHRPSNLLQESSITFASFLSMELNFSGLQEHGFTDTPIDSVDQNSLMTTGVANATWLTLLVPNRSPDVAPKITQPSGEWRATRFSASLVSPVWSLA